MATNGDSYSGPTGISQPQVSGGSNSNLSKDEVGWYFVEQYYTTLSKSPEKLHLFYSKRSQFVYGMEAEVTHVAVGRADIQERIKQLDFHDTKVRISNVDSQASFENIVIQVIGETSIKGGEPKKFVQTFILAQQPSGYFVLNDILRYINDDDSEEAEDTEKPEEKEEVKAEAEPEEAAEPAPEEPKAELAQVVDPAVVDKKLEAIDSETKVPAVVVESTPEPAKEEQAVAAEAKTETSLDPDTAEKELAEEDAKVPEKPQGPSPTPAAPAAAPAPPAEPEKPAAPPAPPKPMTWASRAAAAAGTVRPAVPLPKTATPPTPAQSRPAIPATPAAAPAAATPAATPAAAPAPVTATEGTAKENAPPSEWQTAGSESKRHPRPHTQAPAAQAQSDQLTLAYVKYVTERVKSDDLRNALASFGELTYFDINRQKNCAFVEFATPAGYQAAAGASPLVVNGEKILVEPRRPKATAYGGTNYGGSTRGRGGFERGGYTGRGRGGAARGGRPAQADASAA